MRRALCTCESEPIETTGDDTDADGVAGVPVCFTDLAAGAAGDDTAGAGDNDDDGGGEDGDASPISLTFSLKTESSCMVIHKTKQETTIYN